jgi:hypothetical protein
MANPIHPPIEIGGLQGLPSSELIIKSPAFAFKLQAKKAKKNAPEAGASRTLI